MRILLASGGTAGHIFPALAVAGQLRSQGHEIIFVGVFRSSAEGIRKEGYACHELSARGLHIENFCSICISSFYMLKSIIESVILLKKIRPDRVVGFGGYGAFGVLAAAVLLRMPTLIHEQNVLPGRANRFLAPWVGKIAISFEKSRKYLPFPKTVWTGYPCLRKCQGYSKKDILNDWGLDANKTTILVLGGSQGSHALNKIFIESVPQLKNIIDFQVIHCAGQNDYEILKESYSKLNLRCHVTPFLEQMEKAYCLAHLVISRAGAGTITEIAMYQLPCILIPYPHAQAHQRENASVLLESGNALIIAEHDLTSEKFVDDIEILLKSPAVDEGVTSNLRQVCVSDADQILANEIVHLT